MKTLPCGRTTDQILHKLDDAPDVHEIECQWCHRERRRLKDQSASILDQLRGESSPNSSSDLAQNILSRISELLPAPRTWEGLSSETGDVTRISSRDIIALIREQFERSENAQLNYTEVKANDMKIPHVDWLVKCTVSMRDESSVQQIEHEILEHVRRGLGSKLHINRLLLEITVEDVHGTVLGYSEIEN